MSASSDQYTNTEKTDRQYDQNVQPGPAAGRSSESSRSSGFSGPSGPSAGSGWSSSGSRTRAGLSFVLLLVIFACILYLGMAFLRGTSQAGPGNNTGTASSAAPASSASSASPAFLRFPPDLASASGQYAREVIGTAATASEPQLLIPEGAVSFGGHHYYIYNDVRTSWEDAAQLCRDRGGYLAVINDAGENEFLYQYMTGLGYEEAFFGLTDSLQEGIWVYLSGDTSDFRDWGRNSRNVAEPNNDDPLENYGQLDTNLHDGCWNDGAFGKRVYTPDGKPYRDLYTYICEWNR